jgi:hypothetical protein
MSDNAKKCERIQANVLSRAGFCQEPYKLVGEKWFSLWVFNRHSAFSPTLSNRLSGVLSLASA